MNSDTINLRSETLFPFQFQIFGVIVLFAGIAAIPGIPYLSPFLIIVAASIFTGYRGIQFNRAIKSYRIYNSFLFLRFGVWKEYEEVEMIYVNSSNVSQKIYTRITEGSTLRRVEYNAYILINNGKKEFLTYSKNKETQFKKLSSFAEYFNIEITNNTQ